MIDGIRQNLTGLEPGARKGVKTETAPPSAAAATPTASAELGAEIVEISAPGGGHGGAPLDRPKIDAIRTAIRNNSYPIDYDKLAGKMLEQLVAAPAGE